MNETSQHDIAESQILAIINMPSLLMFLVLFESFSKRLGILLDEALSNISSLPKIDRNVEWR